MYSPFFLNEKSARSSPPPAGAPSSLTITYQPDCSHARSGNLNLKRSSAESESPQPDMSTDSSPELKISTQSEPAAESSFSRTPPPAPPSRSPTLAPAPPPPATVASSSPT